MAKMADQMGLDEFQEFDIAITPIAHDAWVKYKKKKETVRNTRKHSAGPGSIAMAVDYREWSFKESRQDQDVPEPITCPECNSPNHRLERCLSANKEGALNGCPACHNLGHNLDECGSWMNASPWERVEWLIYKRANKPAFQTNISWFSLLKEFLEENPEEEKPKALPWSKAFALSMRMDVDAIQADYDNHRDDSKLPVDPATKDWETACQTFYVHPLNMHRFPNLRRRLKRMADEKMASRSGPSQPKWHERAD